MSRILLQFLITTTFFFVSSTLSLNQKSWISPRIHMRIISGVPNNPKPLLIHCKSKDDDLGPHVLKTGEELDWHFGLDFFLRSVFTCSFNWDSKEQIIVVFKAHFFHYYKSCNWLVKPDGFYFNTGGSYWVKKHDWT